MLWNCRQFGSTTISCFFFGGGPCMVSCCWQWHFPVAYCTELSTHRIIVRTGRRWQDNFRPGSKKNQHIHPLDSITNFSTVLLAVVFFSPPCLSESCAQGVLLHMRAGVTGVSLNPWDPSSAWCAAVSHRPLYSPSCAFFFF